MSQKTVSICSDILKINHFSVERASLSGSGFTYKLFKCFWTGRFGQGFGGCVLAWLYCLFLLCWSSPCQCGGTPGALTGSEVVAAPACQVRVFQVSSASCGSVWQLLDGLVGCGRDGTFPLWLGGCTGASFRCRRRCSLPQEKAALLRLEMWTALSVYVGFSAPFLPSHAVLVNPSASSDSVFLV